MNIKLILADSDGKFAQRLFDVLSEDSRFTVSLFTDKTALAASLTQRKYDAILADKSMADIVKSAAPVTLFMLDPDDTDGVEFFSDAHRVNKYQRVSETVRLLMELYAEASPNVGLYNAKPVKAIAVYSPIGGVGNSTVALSLAMSASHSGSRALYIGLEEFSSLPAFFGEQSGKGLSEVFAKLGSDINFAAKLQSLLHSDEGISYLSGFDNPRDLCEVTPENIKHLLDIIAESGICDLAVFDLGASYTDLNRSVMEQADRVVLVAGKGTVSDYKLSRLAAQMDFMTSYEDKLRLVCNRGGRTSIQGIAAGIAIEDLRTAAPLDICRYIVGGGYLNVANIMQ